FEIIQSFSKDESKKLGAEAVNNLGAELVNRYFNKGHQYQVVTHTDTKHFHNQILVNPVSYKTGKREITNEKKHLYNLRTTSNQISLENGLSIIRETDKEKSIKLPKKVQEIQRRAGNSYRLDLFQKAELARSLSTNFDEYVGYLNEFSVKVAITEKRITYFYEGHDKGIRGDKLGKKYDKKGLIQNFKDNDVLFLNQPQLRSKIRDGISDFKNGKGDSLGVPSSLLLGGRTAQDIKGQNYESFTKSNRRGDRTPLPTDHDLRNSIIPISEIRKASQSDIQEYCKKQKIALSEDQKGNKVLKGREFISIDGYRWNNTKNKTTGSLIDFVASHENSSYLGAISKITGNKNLLLLELYFGEVKRPYTSFHIPKNKQEKANLSKLKVQKFLKHHGIKENLADDLFKRKKVQVDKKGSIWFYPDDNNQEALEFTLDSDKNYKSKRHGDTKSPFVSSKKNEKNVTVFPDFLSFLKTKGKNSFNENKSKSELVLMGLEEKSLHIFLAHNPNVKGIDIVESKDKGLQANQWNFIDKLKKDLKPYGITVNSISVDMAIKKNRSIDISF
ncbi:MAG: relaxase/mobilization nuclease domain-containing protein, partial [Halobacteriovoraceae bacterium]|nr:relaxase/mobilization nuclease domain-containing protein [Halobacteriovoraceae bacterium]